MSAPKPATPCGRPGPLRLAWRLRRDLLSALPAHLYGAKMAELNAPGFHGFIANDPALVARICQGDASEFPKSERGMAGLRPVMGNGLFTAAGADWARQKPALDAAFACGRPGAEALAAIAAAGQAAVTALGAQAGRSVEIEPVCTRLAADVVFRALMSEPLGEARGDALLAAFEAYRESRPIAAAFLPLPGWLGRRAQARTAAAGRAIRKPLTELAAARRRARIKRTAPDDFLTRLIAASDPDRGGVLSKVEVIDQMAVYLLAGHETTAAALAWALYLLATEESWQTALAEEAAGLGEAPPGREAVAGLATARAVWCETLRLYPPLPVLLREAASETEMRGRAVPAGAQIMVAPWLLHRHRDLWEAPDRFDPGRWVRAREAGEKPPATSFLPFGLGPRACPGAGFAMAEGPLLLALLCRAFRFAPAPGRPPRPAAVLTVRSAKGIRLTVTPR